MDGERERKGAFGERRRWHHETQDGDWAKGPQQIQMGHHDAGFGEGLPCLWAETETTSTGKMKGQGLPVRARRRHSSLPLPTRPSSLPEYAMTSSNRLPGERLRYDNDDDNEQGDGAGMDGSSTTAMRQPLRRTIFTEAPATRTAPPSRQQDLPCRPWKQRQLGQGEDETAETRDEDGAPLAEMMATATATNTTTTTTTTPMTTRPLLIWNAPSEESDSGWSSASRRSSSSVQSSSSSFDSEPSLVTSYGRRTWYEQQNTTHEDQAYREDLEGVEQEEDEEEEEDHYARYTDGESVIMRRMFHSVMHGVVLALQSLAALAVLSVFVWMTVYKNPDAEPAFWAWLWQVPSMTTTSVLVLCVVTMITHEVRVLSALALLYLQAAILFMTSVSALIMWVSVAGRSGEIVQSIMVGCCAFLWGMACLGFLRAVVIWRVMEDEERGMTAGLLRDVETYGTIG